VAAAAAARAFDLFWAEYSHLGWLWSTIDEPLHVDPRSVIFFSKYIALLGYGESNKGGNFGQPLHAARLQVHQAFGQDKRVIVININS
jgi:hypothetical protein